MRISIEIFVLLICSLSNAQSLTKRALFLGNSYTYTNNLPQMVADVAVSAGDTLLYDSNMPGGYTLEGHSTNLVSLEKIAEGNWDYVVLQEQSQLPSFPISQVETEVFPYARILDSIINAENPCAETAFFMTWGRKNGDESNCSWWPPVCTYAGMDSLLNLRYCMMADSNQAIVSPVGAVWKNIRQHDPSIELYQADGSHPSVAGTYAAACSFYASFFRKDPESITFDAALPATDAATIRAAAKTVVYDSLLTWHIGEYDPIAGFSYLDSEELQITFINNSLYATEFQWDFGDGGTSYIMNPTHSYASPGTYEVSLVAGACGISDTIFQTIDLEGVGISESGKSIDFTISPNPASTYFTLKIADFRGQMELTLHSFTGLEIGHYLLVSPRTVIGTGQLPEGVYFARLMREHGGMVTQERVKLIIRRNR
ncbi:MAG TPA: PKD domain-containing protein [Bacteroidales bacterium]|nr:PKD domain-containing protein [Bacteroidales bacterium]